MHISSRFYIKKEVIEKARQLADGWHISLSNFLATAIQQEIDRHSDLLHDKAPEILRNITHDNINVRLDKETNKQLQDLAAHLGVTMRTVVEQAARNLINNPPINPVKLHFRHYTKKQEQHPIHKEPKVNTVEGYSLYNTWIESQTMQNE